LVSQEFFSQGVRKPKGDWGKTFTYYLGGVKTKLAFKKEGWLERIGSGKAVNWGLANLLLGGSLPNNYFFKKEFGRQTKVRKELGITDFFQKTFSQGIGLGFSLF